jgi:hypothetical protein
MKTTIDLPDDLFREAKTRAAQQGTTLKKLMTQFILSGLGMQVNAHNSTARRMPPPAVIRRIPGQSPRLPLTTRQLHALLEGEEIQASRHMATISGAEA